MLLLGNVHFEGNLLRATPFIQIIQSLLKYNTFHV